MDGFQTYKPRSARRREPSSETTKDDKTSQKLPAGKPSRSSEKYVKPQDRQTLPKAKLHKATSSRVGPVSAKSSSRGELDTSALSRAPNPHAHLAKPAPPRPKASLVLIRGPIGSGKTTLGEFFAKNCGFAHVETDQYFVKPRLNKDGITEKSYKYEPMDLNRNSDLCLNRTKTLLLTGRNVVVTNNFTTVAEMKPYLALRDRYSVYAYRTVDLFKTQKTDFSEKDVEKSVEDMEDFPSERPIYLEINPETGLSTLRYEFREEVGDVERIPAEQSLEEKSDPLLFAITLKA